MIPYSIREGLAGFRRAKFATVASTGAMVVALVLTGLFGLLSFQANQVSDYLRQRVGELEVFLDENVTEAEQQRIFDRAEVTPGVADAELVTREEAQRIFQEEFGEEGTAFVDELFLPPSVKVRVQPAYATPDSLNAMVARLSNWNRVDEVVFNAPLLAKVQQNLRIMSLIGLALGTLVVLAAIFLVGNTIRLTIYARRLLIRTMKLVGATDGFIRRPFVVEGILQGLLAAVIAIPLLVAINAGIGNYLPQTDVSGAAGSSIVMALALLATGLLLGWLGSFFAVRRFIRKVALH